MTEDNRPPIGQSVDQSRAQGRITVPAEGELRQFIDDLVRAGELVVQDGETSFKVSVSRLHVTNEARTLLAGGGPSDNHENSR